MSEDQGGFTPMWQPIVNYDRGERPTALLRHGNREVFGKLSEYARWGENLGGDLLILRAFEPTEFALWPDDLITAYSLP